MDKLKGKKVAIITEHGFEQSELLSPKEALENAGATVHVISAQNAKVKAWDKENWEKEVTVDQNISSANPNNYDALLVPGGVMNPDSMRNQSVYVEFAKHFLKNGKPVAAICHGPQLLIETGMLEGRKMTSYPSIQTDLKNAGVSWYDKEVVTDKGLVTSRSPKDLDAFNKKIVEEIAEGVHESAAAMN